MCGVVGQISSEPFDVRNFLSSSLKRLEFRGYDSVGTATTEGSIHKSIGKVQGLVEKVPENSITYSAISHCRWATHGGVSTINAHPHSNKDQTIRVVHNGILENYQILKSSLIRDGYSFISDTDTEVIPHYFDRAIKNGMTIEQGIQQFFNDARGTFAVLVLITGENKLYAFKKDSPLVLGVGNGFNVLASDVYAFSHKTNEVIFFEDMEYAVVDSEQYQFFNQYGVPITKKSILVEVESDGVQGDYEHFMLKEIEEQPTVSRRLLRSLKTEQQEKISILANSIKIASKIIFVACGTSYHAALVGGSILSQMGYNVHTVIASEFDTFYPVDDKTLVITISQSGETMDVITVLKDVKKRGAKVAALTNVPYSTIERLSDVSLNILAGQEVAVASTKAFTNQVFALLMIAAYLDNNGLTKRIENIPLHIERVINLNRDTFIRIASILAEHQHMFFLGRRSSYPVAREMALKMREITYIHAEGMPAAELKHGSIALIDPKVNTPVIILIYNDDPHMISSKKEVEARGATTITISNTGNGDIDVPGGDQIEFAMYASIVGQLLSYYTALELGREIDQPRNLAKSVTVG